jgi:hypothetical protein
MKKIITLLFLGLNYCSFGQATSGPYYNLSSGPYSFTEHFSSTILPANMQFGRDVTNFVAPYTGDFTLDAPNGNGFGFNEWFPTQVNGVSMWSAVGAGCCATLFLNTQGQEVINVSWVGRVFNQLAGQGTLRAQYRVGNTGAWTDIGLFASTMFNMNINLNTPITFTLPASCNNQPDVRIRWVFEGIGPGLPDAMDLDDISVTSSGIPLPTFLSSFSTTSLGNKTEIKWSTSSERNTSRFEVEKSKDAKTWHVINQQNAAGNADIEKNYTYTDNEVSFGTSYYRIKQLDIDHQFTYSSIQKVIRKNEAEISIYPNPAINKIHIALKDNIENSLLEILTLDGRILISEPIRNMNYTLNIENLAKGTYIVRVSNKEHSYTSKFIRQ